MAGCDSVPVMDASLPPRRPWFDSRMAHPTDRNAHPGRRGGLGAQGRGRGHGRFVATGSTVSAMMGKFVTDAILVVIMVAVMLAVAAILNVDEEAYEEPSGPYATAIAVLKQK
jgi:hypothetical protein